MSMEYKNCSFELKALSDKGEFEGYATKFNEVDREGDIMLPGCYDKTYEEHKAAGTLPSLLWNHKLDLQCGDLLAVDIDKIGVKVKGVVWKDQGIPSANQAWNMLKGTGVKAMSQGFMIRARGAIPAGVKAKRAIAETEWLETSFTSIPMLKSALITSVKSLDIISLSQAEEILRDAGFSHSEAKAFISGLKKGMEPPRDEVAPALAALKKVGDLFASKK